MKFPARCVAIAVALVLTLGTGFSQAAPLITAQPTGSQAFVGDTSNVSFAVLATGNPAPGYQWQTLTAGTVFTPVAGATNSVYTLIGSSLSPGMDGEQFQCVVTSGSASLASNPATLHVFASPVLSPTLALSTASVSATSATAITITVTGLSPSGGDTVRIDRFLDLDGDGKPGVGEPLVQSFLVTQGVSASIGGVPDPNIFGDEAGAPGTIKTHIALPLAPEIGQSAGSCLIRVSSPGGEFKAPALAPLTITQPAYGQSLAGKVVDTGGTAIPNALVVLLANKGNGNGSEYVASTAANASGAYTLNAPAGTYMLLGVKPGYVASLNSAPSVTLKAGQTLTGQNATLTPASCTIAGQTLSASGTQTLKGVQLFIQSQGGYTTVNDSDSDGNFDAPAVSDQWSIQVSDKSLTPLGFMAPKSSPPVDTANGSVAGQNLSFFPVNALVYGTLEDNLGNPLAGVSIGANDSASVYSAQSLTDAGGNYAIGTLSGTSWWVGPNNNSTLPGYTLPNSQSFVPVSGSATQVNLVAQQVTSYLQGTVKENGKPLAGVTVTAVVPVNDGSNNNNGPSIQATTGSDGTFSLGVTNGSWDVQLEYNSGTSNLVSPTVPETVSNQTITGIAVNVLEGTTTISGTVTDGNNNPLSGVWVTANQQTAVNNGANYFALGQTSANGSYSIPVVSGTWSVNVSQNGYNQQTVTVGSSPLQVNFSPVAAVGYLQGTVTDNGVPVSGAMVDAYPQNPGNSVSATTDTNGNFNIGVTGTGAWNIGLDSGYADSDNLVCPSLSATVANNQTITGIALQVANGTGTISGNLVGPSGNPIAQTGVYASATVNGITYGVSGQTDNNGNFSLPVISGTWSVSVSQNGYAPQTVTVAGSGSGTVSFIPQGDANLSALTLGSGALSPAFSSGNTTYNVSVATSTSTTTVTPLASNPSATLQVWINDGTPQEVASGSASAPLPLNIGFNSIEVQVLAADGTTSMTYTVNIDRAPLSIAPVFSISAVASVSPPGVSGSAAKLVAFGSPAVNNAGHIAVQASIAGSGLGHANNSGIWLQDANGPRLLASTGTGSSPFQTLGDPILNNLDRVAFIGTVKGVKGIWTTANLSGTLQLAAQIGGPVPDTTGTAMIHNAKFATFSQVVLPDQGGVVFFATVNGAAATLNSVTGVSAGPTEGIWGVDTTGLLKRIVSKGDTVTLNETEYTITALAAFSSTAGTTAQTRSFNIYGDLTYQVTLENLKTRPTQTIQAIQTAVFP